MDSLANSGSILCRFTLTQIDTHKRHDHLLSSTAMDESGSFEDSIGAEPRVFVSSRGFFVSHNVNESKANKLVPQLRQEACTKKTG
jgi:hypothetical protein